MFKSYASKITSFLIENKEINQDDYEAVSYTHLDVYKRQESSSI